VRPGDLIYGDLDGMIVGPTEAVEQAFDGAIEKVRGEQKVLAALPNGMTATEAQSVVPLDLSVRRPGQLPNRVLKDTRITTASVRSRQPQGTPSLARFYRPL
jgi:hypothetical protein